MDKLLHWVLLNTDIREQMETAFRNRITHSTRTAGLADEAKVARQLVTMNIMDRMRFSPELSVWREPGTLMEGTYKVEIKNLNWDGQVSIVDRVSQPVSRPHEGSYRILLLMQPADCTCPAAQGQ
jgi:hypothetical protein